MHKIKQESLITNGKYTLVKVYGKTLPYYKILCHRKFIFLKWDSYMSFVDERGQISPMVFYEEKEANQAFDIVCAVK